jgi:hypothetical protein
VHDAPHAIDNAKDFILCPEKEQIWGLGVAILEATFGRQRRVEMEDPLVLPPNPTVPLGKMLCMDQEVRTRIQVPSPHFFFFRSGEVGVKR